MTLGEGRNGLALHRDRPLRVLLLMDAAADSDTVMSMLAEQFPRATVHVESTLRSAMAQLARHWFDVVLSDLFLPDAQNAAVVRAVRTAHPATALVVLSSHPDGDLVLEALAGGAQDYLVAGQYDGPRLATAVLNALHRTRVEEEAHRYLQLARGLLDALEAPTCAIDASSTIVAVNQAWRDVDRRDDAAGEHGEVGGGYLELYDATEAGHAGPTGLRMGAEDAAVVAQGVRQVLSGSLSRFTHECRCRSPHENRWVDVRVTPAVINDGRGAVITHLDMTAMRSIQESLAHQSLHDPLTGLPNRLLMLDRVQQAITDAERHGLDVAVTHLDLDNYQQINDRLGYQAGDALLVQVAERLQAGLRPGDTLARSTGDEFLVLLRDLDPADPGEAVARCHDMLRALHRPFQVGSTDLVVSASAGLAVRASTQGVDELLRSTDAALHEAKGQSSQQVVVFTEELRAATSSRQSLEGDLRLALEGTIDQFVLHYQPVVELASGKVVGVEALVRWQHPVRGLVPPDRFIPLAEATGLIRPLGDWVLDQALRDAPDLTFEGRELDVAVNLSVRQLDDHTAAKLERELARSGLRPGRLVLEVTESALVDDEAETTSTLEALSRLGIKIAIDDFGTGYSSLLYLRRYPIDTLKIDREFVAGLGERSDDTAICDSITSLATAVGASTVGEGIETTEQHAELRSLGCVFGQGYLWSPAVPSDQLESAFAACRAVPVPALRPRRSRAPAGLPAEVTSLVATMHAEGASLHTIAGALNRTVGRHPRGVRWTARTVAQALPVGSGVEPPDPEVGVDEPAAPPGEGLGGEG